MYFFYLMNYHFTDRKKKTLRANSNQPYPSNPVWNNQRTSRASSPPLWTLYSTIIHWIKGATIVSCMTWTCFPFSAREEEEVVISQCSKILQNYRIRYVLEGVKKKGSFITKRRKEKFVWEGVREILGAYSSELAVAIYHCYKVIVERKRTKKQLRVEKMGRQLAATPTL